jgi:hypothetical protein
MKRVGLLFILSLILNNNIFSQIAIKIGDIGFVGPTVGSPRQNNNTADKSGNYGSIHVFEDTNSEVYSIAYFPTGSSYYGYDIFIYFNKKGREYLRNVINKALEWEGIASSNKIKLTEGRQFDVPYEAGYFHMIFASFYTWIVTNNDYFRILNMIDEDRILKKISDYKKEESLKDSLFQ